MRRGLFLTAAALLAVASFHDVRAQDDVAAILGEITQLSGELEKEIPRKLDESLSLKTRHEDEIKHLDQEASNLLTEKSALEADESYARSVCDVTVPEEQYAAAVARCDAAKEPYLRRVDQYNSHVDDLQARSDDLNRREQERAAQAQQLLARRTEIINRIGLLKAKLAAAKAEQLKACTAACGGSKDSASQCMQHCFDRAAGAGELAPVEGFIRPPFSASGRTPEQAIEEYRKSGAANPGPNSLHTNPVPPPPSP